MREDAAVSELASRYGIHATVIHRWKKEALSSMEAGFAGKLEKVNADKEAQIPELHAKIGQLNMDWHSRKVLSWRLSNSMDTHFCVEALEEALEIYDAPEIFNTDQGTQFTSFDFTNVLKENGIKISMDGKGRWMDNVFIEWLWRSLKYECVYLNAFEAGLHGTQGGRRVAGALYQNAPSFAF